MTATKTVIANAQAQAHEWPLWEIFIRSQGTGWTHKHCRQPARRRMPKLAVQNGARRLHPAQ